MAGARRARARPGADRGHRDEGRAPGAARAAEAATGSAAPSEWGPPEARSPAPADRQAAPLPDPPAAPPAEVRPWPPPPPRPSLAERLRNIRTRPTRPITPFWIAAAVALVASAGVAGLLVGRASGDKNPQRISTLELSLTVPANWERVPASGPARALELDQAIGAAPAGQSAAGLVAGVLPPSATPGLPVLAEPLDPTPPRPDLVRLGRLPAYRYANLRQPGTDLVTTLYVVPRRAGSLAVACFAPQGAAGSFLPSCGRAAATLVPAGATGVARNQLERYIRRVGGVIERLDAARAKGRRALAKAATPAEQATAAKAIGADYRRAAVRLGRIPGGGAARASVRPLARDLRATARAYRALAAGATAGSPRAFAKARRAVRRREASVKRRLAAL